MYLNSFILFQFCYQIGVAISRSSLSLFKVDRLWIITVLQTLNFAFWMVNSFVLFIDRVVILFLPMVLVGCMGGLVYVNVIY